MTSLSQIHPSKDSLTYSNTSQQKASHLLQQTVKLSSSYYPSIPVIKQTDYSSDYTPQSLIDQINNFRSSLTKSNTFSHHCDEFHYRPIYPPSEVWNPGSQILNGMKKQRIIRPASSQIYWNDSRLYEESRYQPLNFLGQYPSDNEPIEERWEKIFGLKDPKPGQDRTIYRKRLIESGQFLTKQFNKYFSRSRSQSQNNLTKITSQQKYDLNSNQILNSKPKKKDGSKLNLIKKGQRNVLKSLNQRPQTADKQIQTDLILPVIQPHLNLDHLSFRQISQEMLRHLGYLEQLFKNQSNHIGESQQIKKLCMTDTNNPEKDKIRQKSEVLIIDELQNKQSIIEQSLLLSSLQYVGETRNNLEKTLSYYLPNNANQAKEQEISKSTQEEISKQIEHKFFISAEQFIQTSRQNKFRTEVKRLIRLMLIELEKDKKILKDRILGSKEGTQGQRIQRYSKKTQKLINQRKRILQEDINKIKYVLLESNTEGQMQEATSQIQEILRETESQISKQKMEQKINKTETVETVVSIPTEDQTLIPRQESIRKAIFSQVSIKEKSQKQKSFIDISARQVISNQSQFVLVPQEKTKIVEKFNKRQMETFSKLFDSMNSLNKIDRYRNYEDEDNLIEKDQGKVSPNIIQRNSTYQSQSDMSSNFDQSNQNSQSQTNISPKQNSKVLAASFIRKFASCLMQINPNQQQQFILGQTQQISDIELQFEKLQELMKDKDEKQSIIGQNQFDQSFNSGSFYSIVDSEATANFEKNLNRIKLKKNQ